MSNKKIPVVEALKRCLNCGGRDKKIRERGDKIVERRHRLANPKKRPSLWNEEDINYLEDKYGFEDLGAIAKTLGRSKKSVYEKAHRLGLKRTCDGI